MGSHCCRGRTWRGVHLPPPQPLFFSSFVLLALYSSCIVCLARCSLSDVPLCGAQDVASVSNFNEFQVPFYALNLTVDFDAPRLFGTARLRVIANPGTKVNVGTQLLLDVQALEVTKVVDDAGVSLTFAVEDFTGFGKKLVVDTSSWAERQTAEREFGVTITYSVTSESASVCFLAPSQTADKTYPYMFTQGQVCGAMWRCGVVALWCCGCGTLCLEPHPFRARSFAACVVSVHSCARACVTSFALVHRLA